MKTEMSGEAVKRDSLKRKRNFWRGAIALGLLAVAATTLYAAATTVVSMEKDGWYGGHSAQDLIGFHGKKPTSQRSGTAQSAITDSTTGTAATTAAAGTGIATVTIPLQSLATGLSTSAIDLLTNYTPGYKFKLISFDFVTTVAGTGSGASQTFNLEIGTTNVTGGLINTTLSSTDTIGKITAGSAITAANTGTASSTLSIELAAGGTVFTAGAGYFVIKIQNMDTADAHASELRLLNELRSSLVNKGLIKGQ